MSPATNIRDLRELAKLTQLEVSQASGIHQPNLSMIENGQRVPNPETVTTIKRAIYQATASRIEYLQSVQSALAECRA